MCCLFWSVQRRRIRGGNNSNSKSFRSTRSESAVPTVQLAANDSDIELSVKRSLLLKPASIKDETNEEEEEVITHKQTFSEKAKEKMKGMHATTTTSPTESGKTTKNEEDKDVNDAIIRRSSSSYGHEISFSGATIDESGDSDDGKEEDKEEENQQKEKKKDGKNMLRSEMLLKTLREEGVLCAIEKSAQAWESTRRREEEKEKREK